MDSGILVGERVGFKMRAEILRESKSFLFREANT